MKKIIITAFLMLSTLSFTNGFEDVDAKYWKTLKFWYDNRDKLEEGDIMIFNPLDSFGSKFGHAGIIGKDKKMVDLSDKQISFSEVPLILKWKTPGYWNYYGRKAIVLRYKHMNKEFRARLMKNLYAKMDYKYTNAAWIAPYGLNGGDKYCSLVLFEIYEKSNLTNEQFFPRTPTNYITPAHFINGGKDFYLINIENK